MLNLIIDTIGAVCAVGLAWCLFRASLPKPQKDNPAERIGIEDYLQKITHATGISVYDTFRKCAEDWHVSADRIDKDFRIYLSSQIVPFYVKDFIRKSQKQIDELYIGKGSYSKDKRLMLFYSFLVLLFWGGAVFLSLYVFPNILPEEIRAVQVVGPP